MTVGTGWLAPDQRGPDSRPGANLWGRGSTADVQQHGYASLRDEWNSLFADCRQQALYEWSTSAGSATREGNGIAHRCVQRLSSVEGRSCRAGMFEGATAVIFVTAISDYGSKCFEVSEPAARIAMELIADAG